MKNAHEEMIEQLLKTTIDPLEDRVVVYPDPVAEVTESGIIKPQEVVKRERPAKGTVIRVGPGKGEPMLLKAGDRIIYGRMAGTEIEDPITKAQVLIMRPTDIFAKL
jgi:chaperonin GroES